MSLLTVFMYSLLSLLLVLFELGLVICLFPTGLRRPHAASKPKEMQNRPEDLL
jgi:hypothetical protein